jgi:hypothetical protein
VPDRFDIKPNGGFANRDIGFYDRASAVADVAQYFAGNPPGVYVMEAFLEGTEYAINGQMDHAGRAVVLSISEYERVAANGKPNVYHVTHHVRQDTPEFQAIACYVAAVMEASGLTRCPFHMEVILTAEGPRLVEVGARFGGSRTVFATEDVHGGALDIFGLAAHHYLFDTPYTDSAPDWGYYNRVNYLHFDGIAARTERVYSVEGMEAVEALPCFKAWVVRPEVGRMLYRTHDLYSVPYSFYFVGEASREELREAAKRGERLLRINDNVSRRQRLATDMVETARSAGRRSRWLLGRALG